MHSLLKKSVVIFISAISQTLFAQSPLDREFTQLQEQKEKALAAAVEPVNRRYQAALEALLRRATQAGDLPTANKVDAELKNLALTLPSTKGQSTVKSVTEALVGTSWVWWGSNNLKFLPAGKAKFGINSLLWEWKVTDPDLRVVEGLNKQKGTKFTITFDKDFRTYPKTHEAWQGLCFSLS